MKRGRRDNGLEATAFVALRDVDPRVGEHLLDVLYAAGIAAYLEPTSDVDSYTRAVSLPSPPSDRLFVDRASRPAARSLVDDLVTETSHPARADARDVETEWAAIVAAYDRPSEAPVPPWPADEDAGEDGGREQEHRPVASRRERSPEHDLEEHYVPPPPPPVPRLQQGTLAALVCIAVGTMLLVAPGVLDLGADVSFVLGVLGIVGGVGLLVYRMREKPPYEEDPDDGAVV